MYRHAKYRADIDGLRAVAILSVIGFHAFPGWVKGGFIGVDIFFVISGYLISSIVIGDLDKGEFSFATFYSRRIRRIFPALILVFVSCYVIGWFVLIAGDFKQLGKHIAGGAGFVSNIVLWNEAGYFAQASETKPLLHLWSLGIEEQFYAVLPLLLYLAWKWRINALLTILLILGASFTLDLITVTKDAVAAFYSPLSRFWELMIGSALALMSFHYPAALAAHRDLKSTIGIVMVGLGLFALSSDMVFPGWWALLPTIGAFLILAAGPDAWINRALLGDRTLVWVGLVSYPLYLWHWPLLTFVRILEFGEPSPVMRISAILASLVLAWLTYAVIERPIRSGSSTRLKVAALCSALTIVFAVGYLTSVSDGIEGRAVNKDERAQFVRYYEDLQESGLSSVYRAECSFYDWNTGGRKESIDEDCTKPGTKGTYFLWGDSHAQALSIGIRHFLPAGFTLAQVATGHCNPSLGGIDATTTGGACNDSNEFAKAQIARLRPDVVILAQANTHMRTDWEAIADFIHREGGGKVILVGPVPQWRPSLPLVIAKHYWGIGYEKVRIGLDPAIIESDHLLANKYAGSSKLTYVSIISRLCDADGCRATVPGRDTHNLIASDYGHLTPDGSVFVADLMIRPHLPAGSEFALQAH